MQPIMGFKISRSQFAVGHGGFHAGRIRVGQVPNRYMYGHQKITQEWDFGDGDVELDLGYVFDCGSEHPDAFRRSLQEFDRLHGHRLDILFVSHIHADHINGIDRLIGYGSPDTVVLPYLDFEDMAAMAPTPAPEIDLDRPQARLAAVLRKPQEPGDPELTPADPGARHLGPLDLLAGSGSAFRLDWNYNSNDPWRSADWFLLPYVHRVKLPQRTAFRKALLAHLNLRRPTPKKFRARLLEDPTRKTSAEELKDLYEDHFGTEHNVVSLSLYSGPGQTREYYERKTGYSYGSPLAWNVRTYGNRPWSSHSSRAGWLSTGDAMLKEKKRRVPWREYFKKFDSNISILTLPHHGSIHNFHGDVVSGRHCFAIATTVEAEARIAGIRETIDLAERAGCTGVIVDDKPKNTFSCLTSRAFLS
jgi:hypothetical protein